MGIRGLLPLLRACHRPVHVRDFHGRRVGVDAYAWLHRAAFGCAWALAMADDPDDVDAGTLAKCASS